MAFYNLYLLQRTSVTRSRLVSPLDTPDTTRVRTLSEILTNQLRITLYCATDHLQLLQSGPSRCGLYTLVPPGPGVRIFPYPLPIQVQDISLDPD